MAAMFNIIKHHDITSTNVNAAALCNHKGSLEHNLYPDHIYDTIRIQDEFLHGVEGVTYTSLYTIKRISKYNNFHLSQLELNLYIK